MVQLGGEHLSLAEVGQSLFELSLFLFVLLVSFSVLLLPSFLWFPCLPLAACSLLFPLSCFLVVCCVLCVFLSLVVFLVWFSLLWGDCFSFPLSGNLPGSRCFLFHFPWGFELAIRVCSFWSHLSVLRLCVLFLFLLLPPLWSFLILLRSSLPLSKISGLAL